MSGQRGGIIFRLLVLLLLCSFSGIIYLARLPLLRAAAGFWIVQDRIEPADVIIVIGDDDYTADRATEAATLFRAGWASQVLASGRMLRPYASLADFIARDLQSAGVPGSAIMRFSHRAESTREEALGLRVLVAQKNWRRILLVTSNYHTRRARYILRKVLPTSVGLEVAGAPDSEFEPATWWQSRRGRKIFFFETVAYLVAVWELRHDQPGSSSPAAGALSQFLGLIDWQVTKNPNIQALSSLHR
jgi:uncharacterized SAM-binding protein YcdF (DUF218 family)